MASIYTAPTLSFIETYMNAAKDMDRKREEDKKRMFEGLGNIAKGGTQAFMWQQRKNDLDRMSALNDEENQLRAELDMLWGSDDVGVGSSANFDAIIGGLDYNLMPHNGGLF